MKRGPALVAALVTLVAAAPAWARPLAESGARPLVRLILPCRDGFPGLLRGELEAVGFAVDQRADGEGEDAAVGVARKEGVFAVVTADPSGERALAQVIVPGTTSSLITAPRSTSVPRATSTRASRCTSRGPSPVRVAELLRTAATNAARADAAVSAPRAVSSASHGTDERGEPARTALLGPAQLGAPAAACDPGSGDADHIGAAPRA